jgi:hypothetical protein
MATKYGRSNGSFHRVLACSAGGPGFKSPLRRNTLRCSIQKDVDGSGQASTTFQNIYKFQNVANTITLVVHSWALAD